MPRGDKSSYTDKQKRQATDIEKSYEKRGVSSKTAAKRAWATVNKTTGGGLKGGGSKAASKKTAGRKTTAKKAGAKKTGARKSSAKKPTARKSAAKKSSRSR